MGASVEAADYFVCDAVIALRSRGSTELAVDAAHAFGDGRLDTSDVHPPLERCVHQSNPAALLPDAVGVGVPLHHPLWHLEQHPGDQVRRPCATSGVSSGPPVAALAQDGHETRVHSQRASPQQGAGP